MCSLVDLEILGPREESVTAGEGTHERLLPSMDSNMIDQLVLGFESFAFAWTLLPVAGMVCVLWTSDMVDCQMVDDVRHGVEHFVANFPCFWILPHTDNVHLDWSLLHVSVVGGHVVASIEAVAVVVAGGNEWVS